MCLSCYLFVIKKIAVELQSRNIVCFRDIFRHAGALWKSGVFFTTLDAFSEIWFENGPKTMGGGGTGAEWLQVYAGHCMQTTINRSLDYWVSSHFGEFQRWDPGRVQKGTLRCWVGGGCI